MLRPMTSDSGKRRAFAPDLPLTYALVALALVTLRLLLMPIAPHDFWWHLAQGRRIVGEGQVPVLDYYSYTQSGKPFFDQMWLSQWLLFRLYQLGGLPLIIFAQCLLVGGSYAGLLWLSARRSGHAKICAAVLLLGVMPVSFDNWLVRPQSFALPCFAAFVTILTAYRLRWWPRAIWLLPLIEVFWANAHGSFPLGLILLSLTIIGEAIRHARRAPGFLTRRELASLIWCGALCGAAIFVNPRGIGVLDYVQFVLNAPQTRFSSEWLKPDLTTFGGVYFYVFLLAFLIVVWRRRQFLTLTDALVTLPFAAQAMREGRSILWFAMAAFPVFCVALAPRRAHGKAAEDRPAFNLALLFLVWLMPVAVLPWWKPALGLPAQIGALADEETPFQAVEKLRKLPPDIRPQRLWHDEATGSYLMWAAPEQKIFIDTRFEFYPSQQWIDAGNLRYATGDRAKLIAKYRLDGFLIHHQRHSRLLAFLSRSGRWREVYRDRFWILLVKA